MPPSKATGERYKKVNVLNSKDVLETLCKLLKFQAAPKVDMKPLDGNVLNYHHFMALFKDIVERYKSVTKAWILSAPLRT